jgi:hypothetical protein
MQASNGGIGFAMRGSLYFFCDFSSHYSAIFIFAHPNPRQRRGG